MKTCFRFNSVVLFNTQSGINGLNMCRIKSLFSWIANIFNKYSRLDVTVELYHTLNAGELPSKVSEMKIFALACKQVLKELRQYFCCRKCQFRTAQVLL